MHHRPFVCPLSAVQRQDVIIYWSASTPVLVNWDHTVVAGLSLLEGKSADISIIKSTVLLFLPVLKPFYFKMQEITFSFNKEISFLLSSSEGCLYLLFSFRFSNSLFASLVPSCLFPFSTVPLAVRCVCVAASMTWIANQNYLKITSNFSSLFPPLYIFNLIRNLGVTWFDTWCAPQIPLVCCIA